VTSAETFWTGKLALVTGGASFIGSTLTDQLLARGAKVRIVADLSSGHIGNIRQHLGGGKVDFLQGDLRERGDARGGHGVSHGGRPWRARIYGFALGWAGVKLFSRRAGVFGGAASESEESGFRLVGMRVSEFPAIRR
jgi:hypothetical protein